MFGEIIIHRRLINTKSVHPKKRQKTKQNKENPFEDDFTICLKMAAFSMRHTHYQGNKFELKYGPK